MDKNIFISTSHSDKDKSIANKITYTNIIESIPENKLEKPLDNWQKKYDYEWRWRFLKDKERHVVEISKYDKNKKTRLYYNKFGEWTKDIIISPECDKFVVKEYYVYTNE